ncbi:hypothetical protein [Streptomyces sp. URMC 123]|uniref:hypothetical protein n=1 Tax=Streptomyces sp. URMC 123 TaxID=3423403 RepID=UPI003F1C6FB9
MIPRVSAGVLLICAVLLNLLTLHHPEATAPAEPAAVAAEVREQYGPAVSVLAGEPSGHQDESAHPPLARLSRAVHSGVKPPVGQDVRGACDDTVRTGADASPGTTRACTARDTWNPGAGAAPTPNSLRSFRC